MDLPTHNSHSSQGKESIDLSHQSLKAFPGDVLRLHHLRSLRLDNNALEEVPWGALMALKSLTHLNLAFNKLSALPDALAQWHTLEVLDVSHNCIAVFSHALWPLLRQPEFIIPLPPTDMASPQVTKALIDRYGDKIPAAMQLNHYPFRANPTLIGVPDVKIHHPITGLPLITLDHSRPYVSEKVLVHPGKGYWRFVKTSTPRVRLADNPIMEKEPDLETNFAYLATLWEAEEKERLAVAPAESDSSGDDKDDSKLKRRDKRENTRPKRREQREKAKAYGGARDDKHHP